MNFSRKIEFKPKLVSALRHYSFPKFKEDLQAFKMKLPQGVLALLSKKLLVNSIGVLFDLLGKTGRKEAITAAADYLGTAIYKLFRHLYRADGTQNEDFFSVPARQFMAGIPFADMICTEAEYVDALACHVKEKGNFPPMNNDALRESYPGLYQSLLQIIHTTGERVNCRKAARAEKN